MALNLLRAAHQLCVRNRDAAKAVSVAGAGARVAASVDEVFDRCAFAFLMQSDDSAINSVPDQNGDVMTRRIYGHTIVPTGTTSARYSQELEAAIRAAGRRYVEAPASAIREQAEAGDQVTMIAGEAAAVDAVAPMFKPMCRQTIRSGPEPKAMHAKVAANLALSGMVTSLTEAFYLADRQGLGVKTLLDIPLPGPVSCDVLRVTGDKLLRRDFSPRATITAIATTNQLIVDTAREAGAYAPIIGLCLTLNRRAIDAGYVDLDLIAELKTLEMGRDFPVSVT
jgi:3-hydroxyisobutyrate dehydrogenase